MNCRITEVIIAALVGALSLAVSLGCEPDSRQSATQKQTINVAKDGSARSFLILGEPSEPL